MKIKKGDKVKFLNEVGGGIVTDFIDKKTVKVLNQDGFEIPTLIKELILIEEEEPTQHKLTNFFHAQPFDEPKPQKKEKKQPQTFDEIFEEPTYENPDDTLNVFFAFVPTNPKRANDSDLQTYLINDSNYFLFYNIAVPEQNDLRSLKSGTIEPNLKVLVNKIERSKLNSFDCFIVQILPFKTGKYPKQSVVEKELKINPLKYFKLRTYKENDFFDEPSFVLTIASENLLLEEVNQLSKQDVKKIINQKEHQNKQLNAPKRFKAQNTPEEEVVDLHIHELIEDEKGLTAKEMLQIQLDIFEKKMQQAIKSKLKRIVFIHGVGNGKLKMEVRSALSYKYKKYTFQDASFREYGWGATMVLLK